MINDTEMSGVCTRQGSHVLDVKMRHDIETSENGTKPHDSMGKGCKGTKQVS